MKTTATISTNHVRVQLQYLFATAFDSVNVKFDFLFSFTSMIIPRLHYTRMVNQLIRFTLIISDIIVIVILTVFRLYTMHI